MADVIIVKEFTEEVNLKLLNKVEEDKSLFYVTDNKRHCVVIPKRGERTTSLIKDLTPSMWHNSVSIVQLGLAEVWE